MHKLKTTLCALAIMAAATTGASAKCQSVGQVKTFDSVTSKLLITRNQLTHLGINTADKDALCLANNRQIIRDTYLPAMEALVSDEVEPAAKLKAEPVLMTFRAVLEPALGLAELEKRIAAFSDAAREYNAYAVKSDWVYSESKDEMRGTITHYWDLKSTDTKKLEPPYSEARASIMIFQDEKDGVISDPKVMIYVNDGQLSLSRVSNSDLAVKFDKKEISSFTVRGCGDDNKSMCFFDQLSSMLFLLNTSASNKAIVEIPFYRAGDYQYHFNTAGLFPLRVTPDYMKPKAKK